jgi:uncharacterized protein YkwD
MIFSRSMSTCLALSLTGLSVTAATVLPLIQAAPAAAQVTNETMALERDAHNQINNYRRSQGLPALTWNEAIATQARTHSQNMANKSVPFGHSGFQARVVATKIPYSSAAENVAYNMGYTSPATQAVQGWLKSPGHLANIKGNFNLAGLGVAKNARGEVYFTQVFIRSR